MYEKGALALAIYSAFYMRPSGFDTCKTFTAIPVEDNCGGCADVRPKTLILLLLLLLWMPNAFTNIQYYTCIIYSVG